MSRHTRAAQGQRASTFRAQGRAKSARRSRAAPKDGASFEARVNAVVRSIPKGQLASYSQVALMAGKPGAARQVVRALGLSLLASAPWWRVIRSDGTVAKEMMQRQSAKLEREGFLFRARRPMKAP
jgi:methylated-DNA-protein-cysteine methyltransferase related protein